MSKDSVKPEIRFKEFEDSWEQIEVRKVAPLQRGFDLPKSKMIEGPYPVVFSNGIGGRNTEYKVKGPGVTTGRSGTIGNVTYVDEDYWPHNTSLWVTNFFENYPLYIFYLYQYMDLSKFGTGSGVPTLNRNDVHDYKVALPNPTEQTLISHFLNYIDNTLALHQREHTKLTNFKQSMLQKMFPKEGETVPEVRFEGFSENWEFVSLKDLLHHEFKGKAQAEKLTYGHNEYLDANRLNGGKPIKVSKAKDVTKENILILWDGSKAGTVYFGFEGVLGSTLKAFIVKGDHNSSFIYQYLDSNKNNIFINFRTPNIPHVIRDFTEIFTVPIPSLKEQSLIGNYFNKLDKNIHSKQAELNKLRQIKQAMLDKMFV